MPQGFSATVTSPADRPSRRERLAQQIALVPDGGVVRLSLSVSIYDEPSNNYKTLPETRWTIAIPKGEADLDRIEAILEAVGVALRCILEQGPEVVRGKLEGAGA